MKIKKQMSVKGYKVGRPVKGHTYTVCLQTGGKGSVMTTLGTLFVYNKKDLRHFEKLGMVFDK